MAIKVVFTNRIAEKLENLRQEEKLTKVEISDKLGTSKQNVDSLIRSNNPSIISLLKLSYILNCEIWELFDFEIKDE